MWYDVDANSLALVDYEREMVIKDSQQTMIDEWVKSNYDMYKDDFAVDWLDSGEDLAPLLTLNKEDALKYLHYMWERFEEDYLEFLEKVAESYLF